MPDYIPRNDSEFNTWQNNYIANLQTNLEALGFTPDTIRPLLEASDAWQTDFEAHTNAQTAAQAASQQKDGSRDALKSLIRELTQQIQTNPAVDNTLRASLGITIPSSSRTPLGAPTTRPIATITQTSSLGHTIAFVDSATPNRRAKPAGVMGAEIWVKIGTAPPTDPDELEYLGLDTRTPYFSEFDAEHIGQTAYYRLRWVNRRGEAGPWGDIAFATIAG